MQLTDQGHGHAVESVAVAEAVDEPELGPQQLGAAAQAGDGAGDDKAHQDVLLHREAVELRRRHVQAHGPQLEALGGVEQEIVHQQSHRQGDDEGGGDPQAEEAAELSGLRHGLRCRPAASRYIPRP